VAEIDSHAKEPVGTPFTLSATASGDGATRGAMPFKPMGVAHIGSSSPTCLIDALDTERMDLVSLFM
jgi:hypothetical protein